MKSYKQKYSEAAQSSHKTRSVEGEELKQLQDTLLEMLFDIYKVCLKYDLECILLYGSALGAVRHKGFIPWDDDLDIGMTRRDYEKLKRVFKHELGERYILDAPNYKGVPSCRFPKVLKKGTKFVEFEEEDNDRACIKIDIFIIESVPDNRIISLFYGLFCTFLMFAGGYVQSFETAKKMHRRLGMRELIGKLFSFKTSAEWFNRFDRSGRRGRITTKRVGTPSGREHYFGGILEKNVYFPPSTGVFEGHEVLLPGNTDLYLKKIYGDYMTIPPEDKREKHYIEIIEF